MEATTPAKRRWPVGLLVGLLTAIAAAFAVIPVADWVMKMHHVSSIEGGRACAVVGLWMPAAGLLGLITGFVVTLVVRRGGFVGYLIPQGLALLAAGLGIAAAAGVGYATANHPPLLNGQPLALEIEVQVPAKGRAIETLKAQDFSVALLSNSDARYADPKWAEASQTNDTIRIAAWAPLNSTNAGRQISVGVNDENRQLFVVVRAGAPKNIDEEWSEWTAPRTTFSGAKPEPNEQYLVRYRVHFATEYSPTPAVTEESD